MSDKEAARMISLAEYAGMHSITLDTARQRANRGLYRTAQKIGRNWVIDADEPHIDNRIKSGKYQKRGGQNK